MYKLCVYVPEDHRESLKAALFAAGAGRIGHYSECCWETLGTGQFRPGENSDPFLGDSGKLTRVPEYRIEMVCAEESVAAVVAALRASHPYEEPAFDLLKVETA
ncbi:MAG: YqfO family protein [Halieaceae bacterium]|nr:YqfO family protein [Halieaceae bacterium]